MAAQTHSMGENVSVRVDGSKATITLDLDHRGSQSASGKTVRVASTNGNQKIPGTDITLGLNAYVKP